MAETSTSMDSSPGQQRRSDGTDGSFPLHILVFIPSPTPPLSHQIQNYYLPPFLCSILPFSLCCDILYCILESRNYVSQAAEIVDDSLGMGRGERQLQQLPFHCLLLGSSQETPILSVPIIYFSYFSVCVRCLCKEGIPTPSPPSPPPPPSQLLAIPPPPHGVTAITIKT